MTFLRPIQSWLLVAVLEQSVCARPSVSRMHDYNSLIIAYVERNAGRGAASGMKW